MGADFSDLFFSEDDCFLVGFASILWETDFYPVPVLGRIALSLRGFQTAAQYWIKIVHPWVQKFYPVLGLGPGERLLWHFQTPGLCRRLFVTCDVFTRYFSVAFSWPSFA